MTDYTNYQEVHDEFLGSPEEATKVFVAFEGEARCHAIKEILFEEDRISKEVVCLIILKKDKK